MKHIKDLNEWQDHLQMQADQVGMTKEEWMAHYGSNIDEKNKDGTISDDEDEEFENLKADAKFMATELVNHIRKESEAIGGSFRSPGMEFECIKIIKEVFMKNKFKV